MQIVGSFSNVTEVRYLRDVHAGLLDRWADIEAGVLPEDDDTPRPYTDEQIEDMEAEALSEIEAAGRAREAEIEAEMQADVLALQREIEELYDEDDPDERPNALRRAHRREAQIEEVQRRAMQEMSRGADQVREERAEARRAILADANAREDTAREQVEQLRAGLHGEIEREANRYFDRDTYELDSFTLS